MIHLTDALSLAALPVSIRRQLPALTSRGGRFQHLLEVPGEAICVVALDVRGVVGWSVVEPDGLLGVFVAPRRRRRGTGAQLFNAALQACRLRWPAARPHHLSAPGSPGRAFMEAMTRRRAAPALSRRAG